MIKISQKLNSSSQKIKLEKAENQPTKGNENFDVPKNNFFKKQTTPINHFNKYLINFEGLNRTISKKPYETADEIKNEVAKFPNSKGIVGNLPKEWIDKIPNAKREVKIKKLYKDFNLIVKDYREHLQPDKTAEKLTVALQKAGVIKDGEELRLERLNTGRFGIVFHMRGLQDNYVLKVFKSNDLLNDYHGNYTELNRAAYWQKNAGMNTQMTRFYFGDADAGYMVNKFIDNMSPKVKKNIAPEVYGLYSGDVAPSSELNGHNRINGYQIDYGGLLILDSGVAKKHKIQPGFKNIMDVSAEKRTELLETSDDLMKRRFACQLGLLPRDEVAEHFMTLLKTPDSKLRHILASSIKLLPEDQIGDAFKELADNADKKIKILLAPDIDLLNENDRVNYFRKWADTTDCDIKAVIADNLYYVQDDVPSFFEQLAPNADANVIKKMLRSIAFLPVEQRSDYFKQFAENKDKEVKKVLSYNLHYLPKDKTTEVFKMLAVDADDEVKSCLRHSTCYLPENDVEYCKNLVKIR